MLLIILLTLIFRVNISNNTTHHVKNQLDLTHRFKRISTQKNSVLPILTETLPKKPRKIPIPSEKIFKKTTKKYIAHTREDRILDF